MMVRRLFIYFGLIASLLGTARAQQAASVTDAFSWKVKVEQVSLYKGQGIPFISWDREIYFVENTALTNYANITGKFKQKVVNATVNGRLLPVSDSGNFNVRLEFMGEEKSFILSVTDATGKVYRMQYKIAQAIPREMQTVGKLPFRWRFSGGFGYTLISYRQQDVDTFQQNVVTVKGSATYRAIPEVLDLNASAFFNLLALTSTSSEGNKIQYLGVNLRAGYHVIEAPSNLRFNIFGGFYYNTSYGQVGFADMYGPQIAPEFTYVLSNGHAIFFYGKYAYSLSGNSGFSLKDNREVAFGAHYSFPVFTQNRVSVGIDISQLSLSLSDAWATTNTYSLSGGISF